MTQQEAVLIVKSITPKERRQAKIFNKWDYKNWTLAMFKDTTDDNFKTAMGLTAQEIEIARNLEKLLSYFKTEQVRELNRTEIIEPSAILPFLKAKVDDYDKEHFIVVSLNTRNHIQAVDTVSMGTLTASLVHPREVFSCAIGRKSAKILLAHNHPSDETDPSDDDMKITKRIAEAGKILGIEVLDHIIFTRCNNYLSFKEQLLI